MRVIHCIGHLSKSGGGPSRSVPALARAIADNGEDVTLLTVGEHEPFEVKGKDHLQMLIYPASFPKVLAASQPLKHDLFDNVVGDLYHGHGIWELPVHYVAKAARRHGRPHLIAPRGMLEAWTIKRSRLKKRLVGWLYQSKDLRHADCLHAITPSEVNSFRAYGLKNPVAVVPNGVDLTELNGISKHAALFEERFPAARGRPIVLFLSRVHPKKGLPELIKAWARIRRNYRDWILVIAGPDTLGHRREVEKTANALNLGDCVLVTGALYGHIRLAALAAAEIFVLPSYSEGFSMAVLEAMACQLPVLITPGCNFPEVEKRGAGVISEPQAEDVAHGLRYLLSLNETERAEMGKRGRQIIEECYTWDKVAKQMISVYNWLLTGRSVPDCVSD